MGFVEWAHAMRKKPVEERRRFVALVTILITAGITFVWLILFFSSAPKMLKVPSQKEQSAAPAMSTPDSGELKAPF